MTFDIWPNKTSVFDFTSLMGKEKVKLLDSLSQELGGSQPDEFCGVVQEIWKVTTVTTIANKYKSICNCLLAICLAL